MTLEESLIVENKTRWLDVGCGANLADSFEGVDVLPESRIDASKRSHYHQVDIINATAEELESLGTFDVLRSQHMLEHVTFEEAVRVLGNCAKLLNNNGYIVITVPDLRVYIQKYLNDEFKDWPDYIYWAQGRVPKGAPNSAYFSYYSHAMPDEPHKWCYDYEGLAFQLKRTGLFTNIRELKVTDPLASNPFTHSRPIEDVCVIAQKK